MVPEIVDCNFFLRLIRPIKELKTEFEGIFKTNMRYPRRQSTGHNRQKMAADRDSKFCESLSFEELQNSH